MKAAGCDAGAFPQWARALQKALVVASVVALGLLAGAATTAILWPLPERLSAPPSTVVRYRDGQPSYVFLSPDEKWRLAAALDQVDPAYVRALLRFEDKRFWWHPGVDPTALMRAFAKNLVRGKVVSGGSTVTMQLVRVLEPRPRTVLAKLVESLRAVQLELRMSKEEILAAYLSFIPFGRNIEGVEAASWSYFGHSAKALTPVEIATLLAVPQDPTRRFPTPRHELSLRRARDLIAARLARLGALAQKDASGVKLSAQALAKAVAEAPVPRRLLRFPRGAPHAARWLAARAAQSDVVTTLDQRIQKHVEALVGARQRPVRNLGVNNVAVVVVNRRSRAVEALVGGFDFWEGRKGAQIAGFAIPRSPGSALKPFLYARALDSGVALPQHLVADAPRSVAGYNPRNFDGTFRGLVRLEYALAQSLNLPFVDLLEKLGVENFLGFLAQARVLSFDETPGKYGLSIAAGGIELTALELAGLYAMLADQGRYRPLDLLASESQKRAGVDGVPLLSEGAAFLTRRALTTRDRPDFPQRRDFMRIPARVFWKTGTSFGYRDAWAAGAVGEHVAVVWFGNVDASPNHALIGGDLAAPLLFDVLEGLVSPQGEVDVAPERALKAVAVCAYSGHVPTAACPEKTHVMALARSVAMTPCPYHVKLDIDRSSGLALAPMCRQGRSYDSKSFTIWPSAVKRYLNASFRDLPAPPPLHPDCRETTLPGRLAIASPREGHVVLLLPGVAAHKQELPFEADASGFGGNLSWFVDGALMADLPASERFWWQPELGRHEVVVSDVLGRKDRRHIEVRAFVR